MKEVFITPMPLSASRLSRVGGSGLNRCDLIIVIIKKLSIDPCLLTLSATSHNEEAIFIVNY